MYIDKQFLTKTLYRDWITYAFYFKLTVRGIEFLRKDLNGWEDAYVFCNSEENLNRELLFCLNSVGRSKYFCNFLNIVRVSLVYSHKLSVDTVSRERFLGV